jgi:hypothetical protein
VKAVWTKVNPLIKSQNKNQNLIVEEEEEF